MLLRRKNQDCEALLYTMHDIGNRDSLVYWLEFKDDDEFPSKIFGSIAGGSSFKFGLFRKKETGLWTTGSSQKPVSLSVDEAIVMPGLVDAADALSRVPVQEDKACSREDLYQKRNPQRVLGRLF